MAANTSPEQPWIEPTEADWTLKRDLIISMHANHTTAAIRKACHFDASDKQFRTRFRRWGLADKKHKEHEMAALLRKQRQRSAVNKASRGVIHGKVIDMEELIRYARRKRLTLEELMQRARSQTPTGVECRTPTPSAEEQDSQDLVISRHHSPLAIDDPDHLKNMRYTLSLVHKYYAGSLRGGVWISSLPNHQKDIGMAEDACEGFLEHSNRAYRYFVNGNYHLGRVHMTQASRELEFALGFEWPPLLISMMQVLSIFCIGKLNEVELITRHYFREVSQAFLGLNHPMCSFLQRITALGPKEVENLLPRIFHMCHDIFAALQDPCGHCASVSRQCLVSCNAWSDEQYREYLENLLTSKETQDPENLRYFVIRIELARHLPIADAWRTVQLLEEIYEANWFQSLGKGSSFYRNCSRTLAVAYIGLGRTDVAINILQQLCLHPIEDYHKFLALDHLLLFYLRMNRPEKAGVVLQELRTMENSWEEADIDGSTRVYERNGAVRYSES